MAIMIFLAGFLTGAIAVAAAASAVSVDMANYQENGCQQDNDDQPINQMQLKVKD